MLAAAAAATAAAVREASASAASGALAGDALRLARKVALLSHLADEIRAFAAAAESPEGDAALLRDLLRSVEVANRFLRRSGGSAIVPKNNDVPFKYVVLQIETALAKLPYDHFEVSDEVKEQVDLVRAQLRREIEKIGSPDVNVLSEIREILLQHDKDCSQPASNEPALQLENTSDEYQQYKEIVSQVLEVSGLSQLGVTSITNCLIRRQQKLDEPGDSGKANTHKRSDSLFIPEDFRCPISLELMKDPVIVWTGQTYERAFIQRWIDCGNRTCPKTQQKLQNLTLTPNFVLRSLIMQWCDQNGIEPPSMAKNDGTSQEIGGDRAAFEALVKHLSSTSLDECKSAAAEIRSLAKRSTDNRIMLAEVGAIPALVNLLSTKDQKTQEHAVTSLLNLSIYDRNKELIVLAGAIHPIVQVLRMGGMEARENAAAAIFSLSLIDENKITIGSTPGAIEALVDLLHCGSSRGRKDAATALFNLCIYQANKIRAVRAGILGPLLIMLKDVSNNGSIDEALTILAVLVSHQECKAAIAKANTIPFLIDLLRSGQARNKENAAAILLALCKKDKESLACVGRLGAQIPLTELTKTGTDRAKRKATSLLEHLSKLQVL